MMKPKQWRPVLIGIALAIGCGWYYRASLGLFLREYALPLVCLVVGYTVSITIAWGAYAIAAHQSGYQFHLASIGPVQIAREMGGVRLRRNHGGTHHAVIMLPTSARDIRQRTMRVVWASPVASLVLGLFAIALLLLIASAASSMNGAFSVFTSPSAFPIARRSTVGLPLGLVGAGAFYLGLIAASVALFSLLFALGAFISRNPAQAAFGRWQMLRANGPDAAQYLARLVLSGQSWSGVRPRLWDVALIARANALTAGETRPSLDGAFYAYWHALDCGDGEETGRLIADLFARLDDTIHEMDAATIRCEAAFHAAWFIGDATARALLPDGQAMERERQRLARAEAAVLLVEGRRYEAWMRATEGGILLNTANNLGVAHMESDLLNAVIARAISATPSPVQPSEPAFVVETSPHTT